LVRPPGWEGNQQERKASEERGFDALEEPEAARGLVDGIAVDGAVLDEALLDIHPLSVK
jgi:hypothetical protein